MRINKLTFALAMTASFQLLLGVVTQFFVIKTLGVGETSDVFMLLLIIPGFFTAIFVSTFQAVYFSKLSINFNNKSIWYKYLFDMCKKVSIVYIGFSFLLFIPIYLLSIPLFPNLSEQQNALFFKYFWLFIINGLFATYGVLLNLACKSLERFLMADVMMLIGSLFTLLMIVFMLESHGFGVLVFAYLFGSLLSFLLLLWMIKGGILSFSFEDTLGWKTIFTLLKVNALHRTSPFIDRYILTFGAAGSVTLFSLAMQINTALIKLYEKTFLYETLPKISRLIDEKKYSTVYVTVSVNLGFLLIAMLTVVLSLYLFSAQWDYLFIQWMAFSPVISQNLWWMTVFLVGVFFGSVGNNLINHALYSLNEFATAAKIGVLAFLFSIPLRIFAFVWFGMEGLAIANSFYYVLNLMVLFFILKKLLNGHFQ